MSVLALIPARKGSHGCPGKNLRTLGGKTLIQHAVDCARSLNIETWIELSTDYTMDELWAANTEAPVVSQRPAHLCGDDVPMIDVVKHVWSTIPADSPLDIMVLLQPTQPFRTPAHVTAAIELLQSRKRGVHSVVSVVELPPTHAPDVALHVRSDGLCRAVGQAYDDSGYDLASLPARRQDIEPAYIRDGTVYAFYRLTVTNHGNIYGTFVKPLIIPPEETCELDTEADWLSVERRWRDHPR